MYFCQEDFTLEMHRSTNEIFHLDGAALIGIGVYLEGCLWYPMFKKISDNAWVAIFVSNILKGGIESQREHWYTTA